MSTRKDVHAAVNGIACQSFKDGVNFALYELSRNLHIPSKDIRLSKHDTGHKAWLLAQRIRETLGNGGHA
jgi:hypothetical protein